MKHGSAQLFLNRELSWLAFNERVLEEALDASNPLLERVKFFCIFSSNLDEFFEVRVAGLKQQIESDVVTRSPDGRTATETLRAVQTRVRQLVDRQLACWRNELLPQLARSGIRLLKLNQIEARDQTWLDEFYRKEINPVLTPLGIDPAHPFPQIASKSQSMIIDLEMRQGRARTRRLAVVQMPRVLPRLLQLPRRDSRRDYVFLSDVVQRNLTNLFPGAEIKGHWLFRVTRNSELYIDTEETESLLRAVETELHNRRKGEVVRLEVEKSCPPSIRSFLLRTLRLQSEDLYIIDGPLNPPRLMMLCQGDHSPELRDPPFVAPAAAGVAGRADLFAAIRERDLLLHHPYESFGTVIDFLEQAAGDSQVLAIKQTLYRTGGDARVVGALMKAARSGKQVTAVVELRARFDEENNILWARKLEDAGVHVVYGLVGYKIHCKLTLVVRRDADGIRRYAHFGTGNYNASTAKLYTDLGLLTCRPELGEDVTDVFNVLTGLCQFRGARKLFVAPFNLHEGMLELIERETEFARQGLPARIIAKMNSLVDCPIIEALYRASRAGVEIDLIVRGICCLRPGVKGLSEHIRVRSIVDRFLEHGRIFYFENGLQPRVFIGSADWMPRNFFGRIEVVVPVEDGTLRERIIKEVLALPLADNLKARVLRPNGTYQKLSPRRGDGPRRSQMEFIALALRRPETKKGRTKFPVVKLAPRPA